MGNNKSTQRSKSIKENQNHFSVKSAISNTCDEIKEIKICDIDNYNNKNNVHRQHNHHFLKKHLFQCEVSSPIKEKLISGCKVLDLGCGPATLLLDLAVQYPNSKFIGVDIEPIFPNEIKPKNLEFKIADILQKLPFPDNEFDLVHLESVLCSTKSTKTEIVLNEMVRVSKPNGYIEVGETFIYKDVGEKLCYILHGLDLVSALYGVEKFIGLKLPEIVTKISNIKNIKVEDRAIIIGKNGGKLGMISKDLLAWFDDENSGNLFVNEICEQLELTREQYHVLLKDIYNELECTSPEMTFRRVYAQKIS
ncbi:17272_t:CDS:2 [Funneliformis geosporum]|nr:17272_t:CDS:2 [Funneliformis geosporum]